MITALLIGAGALWLINRKRNGVSGIGAAKRRIFKELSLAQQLGVDFEKKYDELTDEEIQALESVSHDTGYTETYYKSLQKAYNAISGIGETYDVVNADGETVLTWTDDPGAMRVLPGADDPERWRALQEAHMIEDDRIWAENNRAQAMEEREARLAEQRKRLRKGGRTSQMSLFGVGAVRTEDVLEPELIAYLRSMISADDINDTIDLMEEKREPLHRVDIDMYDNIIDLTEDWCYVKGIDPDAIWSVVDPDDILFVL